MTGLAPCAPDAPLRRAQALAGGSPLGVEIARELIDRKLAGQERVAREKLLSDETAEMITCYRAKLPSAETLERVRLIEAQAAGVSTGPYGGTCQYHSPRNTNRERQSTGRLSALACRL